MSETKWTPGPWEVHGATIMADPRSHLPDTMLGIAELFDFSEDRPRRVTEANARLIAAAPGLYEACCCGADELETCASFLRAEGGKFIIIAKALEDRALNLRAALAKARGENHE